MRLIGVVSSFEKGECFWSESENAAADVTAMNLIANPVKDCNGILFGEKI